MMNYGVPSSPADKADVKASIETMQGLFAPREALSNQHWPNGRPRLHIAARCVNLIREIGLYRWAESTDRKDGKDEPVKKDDHAVDCARMIFQSERHYSPTPMKSGPLPLAGLYRSRF